MEFTFVIHSQAKLDENVTIACKKFDVTKRYCRGVFYSHSSIYPFLNKEPKFYHTSWLNFINTKKESVKNLTNIIFQQKQYPPQKINYLYHITSSVTNLWFRHIATDERANAPVTSVSGGAPAQHPRIAWALDRHGCQCCQWVQYLLLFIVIKCLDL